MKLKTLYTLLLTFVFVGIHAQSRNYESYSFVVKSPEQLFIGGILKASSINKDAPEFLNVPLNGITISFNLPISSKEIVPSYQNMMRAIRESLQDNKVLKPSYSFSYNFKELTSYKELDLYFGQNINPALFFGVQDKKKAKTLALVSIEQVFFNVDMDMPTDLCADTEAIKQFDKNELIYVATVSFGRQVMLLIESDLSYDQIKVAVNEMLEYSPENTSKISAKSKSVLANSTCRLMVVGQGDIEDIDPVNPFIAILNYLNKPVTIDNFGVPISFGASYLYNNAMYINKFSIP